MVTTKAVKSTALITLKGKWALSCAQAMIPVFATIMVLLCSKLFSLPFGDVTAYIVFGAMFTLMVAPLWLGTVRSFWRKANNANDSVSDCFYYFSGKEEYLRALKYNLRILLHWLKVSLVLLSPAIVVHIVTSSEIYEFFGVSIPLFLMNLRYFDTVLYIAAIILSAAHLISLYLPAFLFVSSEGMSPKECFERGKEIGVYTKSRFFTHLLGFSGWIVLSLLLIPLLFTMPYLLMAYVVECRYNVAFYNLSGQAQQQMPTFNV